MFLFSIGIFAWLLALAFGVDKDASMDGMLWGALLYVLVFFVAGGVVGMLWELREKVIGAIIVGIAGTTVVLSGCFLMAIYYIKQENEQNIVTTGSVLALIATCLIVGAIFGLIIKRIND